MKTIFERIREDHDKHRTLLELVEKTSGDSSGRRELFDRLRRDLDAHAVAEERCFYSQLLEADLTQDKARHSIAEHKDLDDLLNELEEMDYSSPHWLPRFRKLQECVEHHMAEEEHEVFQMAGKVFSDEEKHALVRVFEALKAQAMEKVS